MITYKSISSIQKWAFSHLSDSNRLKTIQRSSVLVKAYPVYKFSSQQPSPPTGMQKLLAHPYSRLCRFHQPIGAMLLYWPTAWGTTLATVNNYAGPANHYFHNLGLFGIDFYLLSLFLMGSWTSRSAGCIVNDYLDKQFDKNVQRTKNRPLASGQVTTKQAGWLLFFNLIGGLIVLGHLSWNALFVTLGFVALSAAYPLAKRYTNYPQFVLGMCFNSGVIIGSLTAHPNSLLPITIPIYISGIAWTLIYDTVYAYQDIKDDKKLGLKSTAITWAASPKQKFIQFLACIALCHTTLPFFDADYIYSLPILYAADYSLYQQIHKINLEDRNACGEFFRKNNTFGAIVFLGLATAGIAKGIKKYLGKNNRKQDKI